MRVLLFPFLFLFIMPCLSWGLCVSSGKAHLRNAPGGSQRVVWVAPQFTPLVREDNTNYWYKVRGQDGQLSWVFSAAVTTSFKCASIKTRYAYLRKGPGVQFPLADYRVAEKYESFMVLEKKSRWVHLKSTWGEKFWIHKSNLWFPIKRVRMDY